MTHVVAGARTAIDDPDAILSKAHDWARDRAAEVLLADARAVFGRNHLESAVLHGERAKASGQMTARSLPMETLLYLSGQRQVVDALRVAGLRKGTNEIAVVLFDPGSIDELLAHFRWVRDDDVLGSAGKSPSLLGVSAVEESTVPPDRRTDLVLEKVALVDVMK